MKNLILIIIFSALLSPVMKGQTKSKVTYHIDTISHQVKADTGKSVKKADKIYCKKDGITFYQGAKGGIYYYRISSKTGKLYKSYIK